MGKLEVKLPLFIILLALVPSSAQNTAQSRANERPQRSEMDTQPQPQTSNSGPFNAFGGRGTSIGGNDSGAVFSNYDHLDKNRGNLNDDTLGTVADEEDVEDGDKMTPFASSQFYKKKEGDGKGKEDHITEF